MTTLAELINAGFRSVAIDVTGVVIDANSKFAQKSDLETVSTKVTNLETTKLDKTSTASSAMKATQDSAGQQINTTYIKGLSVLGKTITYTKGDGTTGTITTQDTNTTYSAGAGISLSETTFSNSGVRSIAAGSTANVLSINTNGTTSTITINNVANATNATNATSATKATQDGNGAEIASTYMTKQDIVDVCNEVIAEG